MRWPFKSDKETNIRIFRDPKTDEITLRLVGPSASLARRTRL
jgi:hypothetical protein